MKFIARKKLRLAGYDYATPGRYLVTIGTYGNACILGHVEGNVMHLNEAGKMVEGAWMDIPCKYPGVSIEEFIVMPNHLHGIIRIGPAQGPARTLGLSDIVQRFKSYSTAQYRKMMQMNGSTAAKLWHRSFFDQIIGAKSSLKTIRLYIENNPASWALDEENPEYKGRGNPAADLRIHT